MVLSAAEITVFLFTDLSTSFSMSVYNCGLIDLDKQTGLSAKLKQNNNSDFNATVEELVLIYTSHYIANRFAADKNAFFKWYLKNDKGEINDSDDFRKVYLNGQKGACMILEQRYGYNNQLMERKKKLENIFGPLSEER